MSLRGAQRSGATKQSPTPIYVCEIASLLAVARNDNRIL